MDRSRRSLRGPEIAFCAVGSASSGGDEGDLGVFCARVVSVVVIDGGWGACGREPMTSQSAGVWSSRACRATTPIGAAVVGSIASHAMSANAIASLEQGLIAGTGGL